MSYRITADQWLIAASVVWLGMLAYVPDALATRVAFAGSVVLVAGNAAVSLWTLTRRRTVLVGLNCTQIALFGLLNCQLYLVFGADHYRCQREPGLYDWVEFTAAHVLRAADVLDALDEYGLPVQTIGHHSTAAALMLVCMHLTVDVFLLGLLLRWARRLWQTPGTETRLERERREFRWALISVGLFLLFAVGQGLDWCDWLLWPLDNLLRLVDIGDVLQLFGWRLHGVEATYWTGGAGVLFRLAAGVWMARCVMWWRVAIMQSWGVSIEELTELLDDPDAQVRRGAANGLSESGAAAVDAVPSLIAALRDPDLAVRCAAARALGRVGPAADDAIAPLADAAWLGAAEFRVAAVRALGRIGPAARRALPELIFLTKVADPATQKALRRAIGRIAPGVLPVLPAGGAGQSRTA